MKTVDAAYRARRRERSEIGSDGQRDRERGDIEELDKPTLEALRSLHLDLNRPKSTKRIVVPASRMVSSSLSLSGLSGSRSTSKHKHRTTHAHRSEVEAKPGRKRRVTPRVNESGQVHVYGPLRAKHRSTTGEEPEKEAPGDHDGLDQDEAALSIVSEEMEPKKKAEEVEIVYLKNDQPRSSRRTSRRVVADDIKPARDHVKVATKSIRRSNTTPSRRSSNQPQLDSPLKSTRGKGPATSHSRLKRSHSTSHAKIAPKSTYEPSMSSAKPAPRHTSFFGIFSSTVKDEKPPKMVECLICLSDDVPISKSAKLKCGHRMCHSCLKRIFNLSIIDPQHMPPKCCTSDLIPLKHVDRLFDVPFKKKWNKKFQEFTTKNRIYCPSRKCGEWIRPENIHSERGKKYGKCSRCDTKVCGLCNAKWHGKKDCPKDEETNTLLEAAKQAGWQRCHNCRTMVELKEGCNHMTCRCRAEFCMLCGLKWKTCNCPWFNYEQVENDRRAHLDRPGEFNRGDDLLMNMRIPERPRRIPPRAYRVELDARRRQERLDEDLATRIQMLGLDGDDEIIVEVIEDRLNDDIRAPFPLWARRRSPLRRRRPDLTAELDMELDRELDGPIHPQPHPRPALRRPGDEADEDNTGQVQRRAERPMLRRPRTDYVTDAARYAPLPVRPAQRRSDTARPAPVPAPEPRRAILAGLRDGDRGGARVSAWAAHVELGVTPEEGVISTVTRD